MIFTSVTLISLNFTCLWFSSRKNARKLKLRESGKKNWNTFSSCLIFIISLISYNCFGNNSVHIVFGVLQIFSFHSFLHYAVYNKKISHTSWIISSPSIVFYTLLFSAWNKHVFKPVIFLNVFFRAYFVGFFIFCNTVFFTTNKKGISNPPDRTGKGLYFAFLAQASTFFL